MERVNFITRSLGIVALILLLQSPLHVKAQVCTVRDGKIRIELTKSVADSNLQIFVRNFNLEDLDLKHVIENNFVENLIQAGWKVDVNNRNLLVISKTLEGMHDFGNPEDKILFTGKNPSLAQRFPVVSPGVIMGRNRFKNLAFTQSDSTITFFYNGSMNAKRVVLSGSFSNWSPDSIKMTRTLNGWEHTIRLKPGKYWYKFIVDGNWITDPNNDTRENDGLGNMNSVVYKTNTIFRYRNPAAGKVILSGSFNDWNESTLVLEKKGEDWEIPVYLADGTYTYRFIVDGRWLTDPSNPEKVPNEFDEFNSVIRLGKPYRFFLPGHTNQTVVFLAGNFNKWKKYEYPMKKVEGGWELQHTLGPGNYFFNFFTEDEKALEPDQSLVLEPNHQFRLTGHADAKKVTLAGDFNNWDMNSLAMTKDGNDWIISVHLSVGKHLYKFIVDGKWILDPNNKLWEQNRHGTGDSIIWFEN